MAKMSWCSCAINLRGDLRTKVFRGRHNPVSWPELQILYFSHGKTAISEVKVVAEANTTANDEAERLQRIYGDKMYKTVYPLPRPQFEFQAPGEILRELEPPKPPRRQRGEQNPFDGAAA